jgi:hypothetical protein
LSLIVMVVMIVAPGLSPATAQRDAAAAPARFSVWGGGLNPDWVRINRGQALELSNNTPAEVTLRFPKLDKNVTLPPGKSASVEIPKTGIHQIYVVQQGRTRSSFLMVEPVETASPSSGPNPYQNSTKQ